MNKFLTVILITAMIPLLYFGTTSTYGKPKDGQPLGSLLLAESLPFHGSPDVILSYYGYMTESPASPEELLDQGTALSERLGLPVGVVEAQPNTYPGYAVQSQAHGSISLSLKLVSAPDHPSPALSLTLQSSDPSAAAAISTLKEQLDEELSDVAEDGAWTTVVQGDLAADADDLIHGLSDTFGLKELARYQDTGTLSISYHSELAHGPRGTNFQLAFQRHSETGQTRVTLGTPAIHVEY